MVKAFEAILRLGYTVAIIIAHVPGPRMWPPGPGPTPSAPKQWN